MLLLRDVLSLFCRLFVAFIFLYASYDKVLNPANFAPFVAQYDVIPIWMVNWGSSIFAWIEFIIGILLVIGWHIRPAALISSVFLIFFIV